MVNRDAHWQHMVEIVRRARTETDSLAIDKLVLTIMSNDELYADLISDERLMRRLLARGLRRAIRDALVDDPEIGKAAKRWSGIPLESMS